MPAAAARFAAEMPASLRRVTASRQPNTIHRRGESVLNCANFTGTSAATPGSDLDFRARIENRDLTPTGRRGPPMGTRDSRVDAYIAKAQPFAKPILTHIRKTVHAACPDVEETMKWSFPHFDYKGMLCSMAAFKAHCAFGFWKAALLKDSGIPAKSAEAMGQFGRITSLSELPPDRTLVALVRKAASLNDDGVKAPRRVARPRTPIPPPAAFVTALKKHRQAQAAFAGLSPSHQREYLEWIVEAKTDATRDKRIATSIEWLSDGKSRNWKYASR
jgi:uncharacterized protein YdeI (YjbR/CyaY-like superfamily)